jgi:glyoxylase-like metal-dependent hydrolase (beta-lactamase superfamily II)
MSQRDSQETPRPPETAEFGHVVPGGPAHEYPPADGAPRVTKLSVGPYDNNVYVLAAGGEALIVDGAAEPERILEQVRGLRVVAIVQTHDHPDHVQALPALVAALACPVRAHPEDSWPVATEPLDDGTTIPVGGFDVRAVHTPGHTPGSTCYVAGPFLFSGDTLFPGGPGNTGGDAARFRLVMASLDRVFATLPDGTRICPGHGLDSTIGRERPYVDAWRARGW